MDLFLNVLHVDTVIHCDISSNGLVRASFVEANALSDNVVVAS